MSEPKFNWHSTMAPSFLGRASLATFLAIAPAAFAADGVSFQGLDGSSTKDDVLKAFPQAKITSTWCQPGQSSLKLSDGEYSCFQLSLSDYVVGSEPYNLSFLFLTDGSLRLVRLSRYFGGHSEHTSKIELRRQYESLYQALNYKYGDPLKEPQTLREMPTDCTYENEDVGFRYNKCAEWQGGQNREYEPGQNHIKLGLSADDVSSSSNQIRPDGFDGYIGAISISYTFADVKSAGKL